MQKIKKMKFTRKQHNRINLLVQKLIGMATLGLGILVPFVLDGDATISLLLIPIGFGLIFTQDLVIRL